MNPLDNDQQFFTALLKADTKTLDRILAGDFILIDVMTGSENTKPAFMESVRSGQVRFNSIEAADQRVRLYQDTAVITGRTHMKGRVGDTPISVQSRYTHIYVVEQSKWRLVTAQGTQIASPTAES